MNINDFGIILLILIAGVVGAFIRSRVASSASKQADEVAQVNKNANNMYLDSAVIEFGINADSEFVTECSAAAIDMTQRKPALVCKDIPSGKALIDITDIDKLRVDDRMMDYKLYQKQSRAYTGIERYSGISKKDAKYGHERLQEYGRRPIWSVGIILKDGTSLKVPFMLGDGTHYWNKENDHNTCKVFVSTVEQLLNDVRREET